MSRVYEGIGAEEVLAAAKKVLRLAGYSVFPKPQGFMAVPPADPRQWKFWTVSVAAEAEGVLVRPILREHYGGPTYDPRGSAYSIFFDRLDYLLKRRPTWVTCAQAAATWPASTPDAGAEVHCFRRVLDKRKASLGVFIKFIFIIEEPDPDAPLPPSEPSDAEWLALTTRRFQGVAAARLTAAAREALGRLYRRVAFRDLPDGLVAARRATRFRFFIFYDSYEAVTHYWEFRVREADGDSLASVYWTSGSKGQSAAGFGGVGSYAEWVRHPGWPNWSKWSPDVEPYRLFWMCVDSVLASLPTCEGAEREGGTVGVAVRGEG